MSWLKDLKSGEINPTCPKCDTKQNLTNGPWIDLHMLEEHGGVCPWCGVWELPCSSETLEQIPYMHRSVVSHLAVCEPFKDHLATLMLGGIHD